MYSTTERIIPRPSDDAGEMTFRLRKASSVEAPAGDACAPAPPGLERAARAYQEFCDLHGTASSPAELERWSREFTGDPHHARLFRELHQADPLAADRLARAMTDMPAAGSDYHGFRLVRELGRGAFGRVFLARQGELAGRPVVLKIATDLWGEVHALAQLQHVNVVPIYSVHLHSPFQAVCMPYLGATTLEDVLVGLQSRPTAPTSGKDLVALIAPAQTEDAEENLRLDPPGNPVQPPHGDTVRADDSAPDRRATHRPALLRRLSRLSYVETVLWIGARLADGLAHAHERGIIHRDLKPANVLITDEGQPLLLDFSVAEDTKLRDSAAAAWVGGTLPYMSPEHLAAFQGAAVVPDARSDVYALGVMLFELLTLRHPFRMLQGPSRTVLQAALQDRQQPAPRLRPFQGAISPAVESIVRHCLEPDPARRYQSAAQLLEDLERHLRHRPLRHAHDPSPRERLGKWFHRHPALTSLTTLGGLAAGLLALLAVLFTLWGNPRARGQAAEEARHNWGRFQKERRMAQFALYTRNNDPKSLEIARKLILQALGRYGLPGDATWQQRPVVQLLSDAERQRLREEVADLLLLLAHVRGQQGTAGDSPDHVREALQLNHLAEFWDPSLQNSPSLWLQRAGLTDRLGSRDEAAQLRARAAALSPQTARDLCWLASEAVVRGELNEAIHLLQAATYQEPKNFWAWFVLGTCYDRLAQPGRAEACYSTCIALEPDFHGTYFSRGQTYLRQRNYRRACQDFDEVLRQQPELAEVHFQRALARWGLGQYRDAITDLVAASARP